MIKVVIVSHEPESAVALLDWMTDISVSEVTPSTIDKILQHVLADAPNIIIIEQNLEPINADMLCHLLSKQLPKAQSLMLTDETPTFEMLQNTGYSVRGYITREQRSSLAKAVRVVHQGEAWLPRTIVTEMLNQFAKTNLDFNESQLKIVN
ncbi:MAG: response regulator transcription factor [Piscirickettsiaceae bacterium]|nr:response regulator transcription factor [Piscirickettsiaceae bacterium]